MEQAATAAHNMLASPAARRAYHHLPAFWSNQFGVNIRSVGLPTFADSIVLTEGSFEEPCRHLRSRASARRFPR